MRSKHDFVCINCPLSCSLTLTEENGKVMEIAGADCGLGERYATEEFTDPRRIVTTTVRVRGGSLPLLPVRTAEPVPKNLSREAVDELSGLVVEAPVEEGQVVLRDLLGTGVDVISSRRLDSAAETD